MLLIWYLEEEPVAPVWIVGGQLQGARQDLLGVARVALLLVHPAHRRIGVEEWIRNAFYRIRSRLFRFFRIHIWIRILFRILHDFFYYIFNSHFIYEITTRYTVSFCRM